MVNDYRKKIHVNHMYFHSKLVLRVLKYDLPYELKTRKPAEPSVKRS